MRHWVYIIFLLAILGCGNEKPKERIAQPPSEVVIETAFEPIAVAGQDYRIDDQHSYIGFKINYFGFSPVRGRFNTFNGTVFYDPEAIEKTQMTLFIDVKSINTGNERRDNDLITGSAWFNENEFPQITFFSKRVELKANGAFELVGDFKMNGVQKELVIPFEKPTTVSRDFAANEQVDYSGKLTINRKDFNVNGDDFWDTLMEEGVTQLSDEVTIELDIHTRRPDYPKRYLDLEADNVRRIVLDAFSQGGTKAGMEALRSQPDTGDEALSSGAVSTIGNTLMANKALNEAQDVFKFGIERFPDRTSFPVDLAVSYVLQNDLETARKEFMRVVEVTPTHVRAVAYLGLLDRWRDQQK